MNVSYVNKPSNPPDLIGTLPISTYLSRPPVMDINLPISKKIPWNWIFFSFIFPLRLNKRVERMILTSDQVCYDDMSKFVTIFRIKKRQMFNVNWLES